MLRTRYVCMIFGRMCTSMLPHHALVFHTADTFFSMISSTAVSSLLDTTSAYRFLVLLCVSGCPHRVRTGRATQGGISAAVGALDAHPAPPTRYGSGRGNVQHHGK